MNLLEKSVLSQGNSLIGQLAICWPKKSVQSQGGESAENFRLEKNNKRWKRVERPVRTYLTELSTLLARVTEPSVAAVILKHVHQLIPYFQVLIYSFNFQSIVALQRYTVPVSFAVLRIRATFLRIRDTFARIRIRFYFGADPDPF